MKNIENYIIRDAIINDLPSIVDIYNSTIPGRMVTADLEPVTVENKKEWFEQHSSNHRPIWVIEDNDNICGWLSFQSFYGRPAYDATAEISIYISKEYRGKGLGHICLTKAIEECRKLNINTLLGFIFGHNKPSLNLFNKYGFNQWGNLPKIAVLDGIERDLVILGKRIL